MSMYILSTMSNSVAYRFYNDVAGLPVAHKTITIHGGARLPNEKIGFGDRLETEDGRPIWTADGLVTAISDSDYELLKDHHVFKAHLDGGYLKVINRDITQNYKEIKRQASGMSDDGQGQLDKSRLDKKVKSATVKSKNNLGDDEGRI